MQKQNRVGIWLAIVSMLALSVVSACSRDLTPSAEAAAPVSATQVATVAPAPIDPSIYRALAPAGTSNDCNAVAASGCGSDSDCAGYGKCASGKCGHCGSDSDCKGNGKCSGGMCNACGSDSDCASGKCSSGKCGSCGSDSDCKGGKCSSGRCGNAR